MRMRKRMTAAALAGVLAFVTGGTTWAQIEDLGKGMEREIQERERVQRETAAREAAEKQKRAREAAALAAAEKEKRRIANLPPAAIEAKDAFAKAVVSVRKGHPNAYTVAVTCDTGTLEIGFLKDNVVRLHVAPPGKAIPEDTLYLNANGPYHILRYDWGAGALFDLLDQGPYWLAKGRELAIRVYKSPCRLEIRDGAGRLLVEQAENGFGRISEEKGEATLVSFVRGADERFFGLGGDGERRQNRPPLDRTGYALRFTAGEGAFRTPFYYSSKGYGVYLGNFGDRSAMVLGSPLVFTAEYRAQCGLDMDLYFLAGPRFERILEAYTEISGRPPLPEKWFFGMLMSNYSWGSPEAIMDAATRFREGDWPLDALIEDYAWRGNKDVAWAPEYAPAREKMFRHLDANKVRLGLHVNERNIYDATDPAAIAAQWPKYRSLVEDGVDFWWQDHGERSAARESKSLFGTLWAKVLAENMARMGKYVPVIGRSAGSGGQRYISPWGGDIGTDFDLLKTDLAFIRDAGLAGYAYAGCDMGGFGSDRSDLVIMRRVAQQFLVFPVTRPHGARSKPPWTVSKAAQDMWRFYSRLRYRLHPYVYSAAIEAARTGRPILAPLVFDHQDDPATYSRDYDFIFGRDLLVAPVVEKAEQREVYLPKGRWIHYWSGETHEGGKTVSVVAPLMGRDGLPLFAREGAILPMMPETGVTPEKAVYPLALDIYPPAQGVSSRLLLDTETPVSPTVATRMSCSSDKDRVVVETDFRNRALTLIIHAKNEPQRVLRGETELVRVESLEAFERAESGWFVGPGLFPGNEALRTINVKVEAGDAPQPVVLKP